MEKLEEKVEKAVIVVHGIGDQLQGDTLERLATSYVVNEKNGAVDAAHLRKSTLRLRTHVATGEGKRDIETFKADVLRVDHLPGVAFAEVYWADLSRIMAGIFGFLIGVWKILTGLRFVIAASADALVNQCENGAARFVRLFGGWVTRALVGSLVALNALIAIVVVATYWFDESFGWQCLTFVILSALFLAAIYGLAITKYIAEETKRDAVLCYAAFTGILLLLLLLGTLEAPIDVVELISDVFWSLLSLALFFLILVSGIVYISDEKARSSLTIACVGPCLIVGLWALALSNVWILGVGSILPPLEEAGEKGQDIVFKLFPLLSILWLAILAFGAALLRVFLKRGRTAKSEGRVPDDGLRLIFSKWAALVIIAAVIIWFFATFYSWLLIFGDQELKWLDTLRRWTENNLWLVAIIIGVLGFFAGTLSRALDLLLDIITYFRLDSVTVPKHSSADAGLGSGADQVVELTDLQQQRITDRFQCLVTYMVREQGVKELTVMAHSQGTITAIEQLRAIDQWLDEQLPKIELITIGSPYTHIYQEYFSDRFQPPAPTHVTKWINIYTVDDYVGTHIDDSASEGTVPKNIEREAEARKRGLGSLAPIGHNGYWTDEVVMQIIKDETPF